GLQGRRLPHLAPRGESTPTKRANRIRAWEPYDVPAGSGFSVLKRRRERPTELERPRPVARATRGGGAEKLRYRLGKHAETLGVLEGIAAHMSDDAIARVLDLVEEGAPRRDVVAHTRC